MKLTLKKWNWSIGEGAPLAYFVGLNVLEDEMLALETGAELQRVLQRHGRTLVFMESLEIAHRSS